MKNSKISSPVFADEKWAIEEDLRTLQRAREINRDPKRMAKVRKLAKEQLKALNATMGGDEG